MIDYGIMIMRIFNTLFSSFFGSKAKNFLAFCDACKLPETKKTFFSEMKTKAVSVKHTSSGGDQHREFYLFKLPFFWSEMEVWIIGGQLEEDMANLCCSQKTGEVCLVRQFYGIDETEIEKVDSSLSAFLDNCIIIEGAQSHS